MRVKFDFQFDGFLFGVLLYILALSTVMILGDGIINYLIKKDSILAIHGSFLAGVFAVIAAYFSIKAVRDQIDDSKGARAEERINAFKLCFKWAENICAIYEDADKNFYESYKGTWLSPTNGGRIARQLQQSLYQDHFSGVGSSK